MEAACSRDLHRYDDLDAIVARIRAGESAASISREMGLTEYAVLQSLYYRNLSVRKIREAA
jgi:hypothetical protein